MDICTFIYTTAVFEHDEHTHTRADEPCSQGRGDMRKARNEEMDAIDGFDAVLRF